MSNNLHYLNFVTDIKRAVFCLSNMNKEGAQTFLDHANGIYETLLKDNAALLTRMNFSEDWRKLYIHSIDISTLELQKYCEELLTFSSIIFSRATNDFIGPELEKMDGSPNSAKAHQLEPKSHPSHITPSA